MAEPECVGDTGALLLEEDYFDGPGEEPWVPLVPGNEPDRWGACGEGLASSPGELGSEAAASGGRFRDVPGEGVADGGWRAPRGEGSAGRTDRGAGDRADAEHGAWFGPGGPAEAMPAGAVLHALVEQAVAGGLPEMPDDAVVGVVAAARRLRSHAELLEVRATQEFAHRRWEPVTGPERGKDGRWLFKGRDAEFAADELAFELVEAPLAVQERMDLSLALRDRLPQLDARLGNGVDLHRCRIVHEVTEGLSDEHARQVDTLLAPEAAGLRYGALRRRARKLAMMLEPDAERDRRERATRKGARVEAFPERSGNYAIAGRELPVEEVLASRAYIRAVAVDLRVGGVKGSLRELDLMVFLDLTQGRDPRDRIPALDNGTPAASGDPDANGDPGGADDPDAPCGHDDGDSHDGNAHRGLRDPVDLAAACLAAYEDDDAEADGKGAGDEDGGADHDGENEDRPGGGPWPFSPPGPGKPGGHAPFPAKINLLVPVGSLLGWSGMPGQADRDLIDPRTLRDLVQASSHHPATRWCVTVVGADGTAAAHGCAKSQHPWVPPPDPQSGSRARDGTPTPAHLGDLDQLLSGLKAAFKPIAKDACDHRYREDRYRPGRALQDLVRARNATCPAPGCQASSAHADLDHTRAWPDGDTDECNLGTPCRHDHRLKQAPGWELTQPEPGFFRWKTPSGRVYTTGPTKYDT